MTEDKRIAALAEALRSLPVPASYEEWQARVDASYEEDAAAILAALDAAGWALTSNEQGLRGGMACDPATTHRYERIGRTDRLRCVRCWREREG
jgi:hypothetical protein